MPAESGPDRLPCARIPDDRGAALVRDPHAAHVADLFQAGTGRLQGPFGQRGAIDLDQPRERPVRAGGHVPPGLDRPIRTDDTRSYSATTNVNYENADGPPLSWKPVLVERTLVMRPGSHQGPGPIWTF